MTPTPLQLLAPARDLATGIQAILHGTDAVYIGPETFGARSRAGNSLVDIKALVDFARPYNVRIYVTVNTIIYDNELSKVQRLIWDLYHAGVDGIIVQDLALLILNLPPIALHASTQCDARTPQKAKFLAQCGFTQIVIPRESSLEQIKAIAQATAPAKIEAFVHGALCVSYSGDCQASLINNGRSANRGDCAQMCRLPYTLIDGNGNVVGRDRHYLSLRDLNRLNYLEAMADAGVSSFKIEGRLKDISYVKNVVAAYRKALDKIIISSKGKYCRASRGNVSTTFTPDTSRSFNRRFTPYFLTGKPGLMASIETPKSIGQEIGEVISCKGKTIRCRLSTELNNGDGITYITPNGTAGGFRINRVDGSNLILNQELSIPRATKIYRNYDRIFNESLSGNTATRKIPVEFTLKAHGSSTLILEGSIESTPTVTVALQADISTAIKPDDGRRATNISKLGETPFVATNVTDLTTNLFIPASTITAIRREWCEAMLTTLAANREIEKPGNPSSELSLPQGFTPSRHDNIANEAARRFYASLLPQGTKIPVAAEVNPKSASMPDFRVMTTRYCLRRELGACLRQGGASRLPGPLWLHGADFRYRLDFNCAECQMYVIANPTEPNKNNPNLL